VPRIRLTKKYRWHRAGSNWSCPTAALARKLVAAGVAEWVEEPTQPAVAEGRGGGEPAAEDGDTAILPASGDDTQVIPGEAGEDTEVRKRPRRPRKAKPKG
jgi:hypothetical protein